MRDASPPPPLLAAQGLSKRYVLARDLIGRPTSTLSAVDDVSFELRRGETLGLVGETGSGKSTLAHLVLRLTAATSGTVRFDGQDVLGARGAEMGALRRRMQMVFQDPSSALDPRMDVATIVDEGLRAIGTPRAQRRGRVAELLDEVGLAASFGRRYPHMLSGGQRQRVSLARALAVRPELLVLDEPVSALDVSVQSQILNLLADLREQLDLTCLFISHDLGVVRHVADHVGVMYLGRLVESGPTEALFSGARHPYTQALLSARPGRRRAGGGDRIVLEGETGSPVDPGRSCRFADRCPRVQERCRELDPALERVGDGHMLACFNPAPPRGEVR